MIYNGSNIKVIITIIIKNKYLYNNQSKIRTVIMIYNGSNIKIITIIIKNIINNND
jgi:hypothetical protein